MPEPSGTEAAGPAVHRIDIDPVVAVCADAAEAREAVQRLADAGFARDRLSVVGKGRRSLDWVGDDEHILQRLRHWGGLGGICGAIGGLMAGPVLFFIAPVGLMAAVGPFTLTLLAALEGALVGAGASAIIAALASVGVGREQARRYEEAVTADGLLVIVHAAPADIERARQLLLEAIGGSTALTGPPARLP